MVNLIVLFWGQECDTVDYVWNGKGDKKLILLDTKIS